MNDRLTPVIMKLINRVLDHRPVPDLEDVAKVGRVAAGPGFRVTLVAEPTRDLDELLGREVGVGSPRFDPLVFEEAVESSASSIVNRPTRRTLGSRMIWVASSSSMIDILPALPGPMRHPGLP